MTIPFTQYLRPDGRPRAVSIDRSASIEAAAAEFLRVGGRYECEELTTGEVSLTAVLTPVGEAEPRDVEGVVCANGPPVLEAVDELVLASLRHIKQEQTP